MKNTNQNNGPSQRQLRVGEQIRHIIAETLTRGHFRDVHLIDHAANITVTEVRPAPDLKQATAYVISLGGQDMDLLLPALNNDAHFIQSLVDICKNANARNQYCFNGDNKIICPKINNKCICQ